MDEQVVIQILLVGTKGQLDRVEPEFRVLNLEDQSENAKHQILELVEKYKNYGFTLIRAEKDLEEQILQKPKVDESLYAAATKALNSQIEENEKLKENLHRCHAQSVKYLSELATRRGQVKFLREALEEIIKESAEVDIDNWPTKQQICQAIAQQALKEK